ncbi:MAG: DNA polymerase III subunit gamma/tau [Acidobacteria bacterium]|nr:DNA polymerase III subunit gamma/tau [Acidobacteriota bacterium]
MTYQALARKWRPQRFAELVGQEAIVTALGNALREGRIAQAYLFSGIRGVGKTTAARVLAKALNCVGPDGSAAAPAAEPCNECPVCAEITQGGDLDVLEIDAATYSKVDQVRDLTESLKYGPARDRYKVVVLDEIHRLSGSAFDALLKIVEEPPPHLTFIFATTEIEKVPATVLSRCQEFHFRRVAAREMVAHLTRICEAEGIEASRATLHLIARASEGSVRDAVALLDQLATFGDGKLADEDVGRLLGGIDTELLSTLLSAILAGDGAQVSRTIRSIEDGGSDPRQVFTHFLGFLRSALHLAQGLDPEQVDLPGEAAKELARVAADAGYENLLRLLHLLLSSETVVRRADAPGLALEVALLRAAELPRLVRIEQLGATLPDALPAATESTAPPGAPAQGPPGASGADGPAGSAGTGDEIQRLLAANHPSLAGLLDFHKARFAVQGSTLVITAVPALEEALRDASKAAQLKDAARAVLGPDADWKTTGAAPGAREDAPSPAGRAPRTNPPRPARETAPGRPHRRSEGRGGPQPSEKARRTAEENPTVRAVLDIFGGRVVDVRPRTH